MSSFRSHFDSEGMGTEVQAEMYLQEYYYLRDLNSMTGNGNWPKHHESNTLGQYYDLHLPRTTIVEHSQHGKEQLRQTILKHESVFRHQLHELHRLYHIQRDMMGKIKTKEVLERHQSPLGVSQSSPLSSLPHERYMKSGLAPHPSSADLKHCRPPLLGIESNQSHSSYMKGKFMQTGYDCTQNGLSLKATKTLGAESEKLQRTLFDLELPADEYTDNEEKALGVSGESQVESNHLSRNYEVTGESNGALSLRSFVNPGCNGDSSSSTIYAKRTHGLTDLNEPVQVEEESGFTAVDNQRSIIFSNEEIRRKDPSVNSYSGFQLLDNGFREDPHKGRGGGYYLSNLYLDNDKTPHRRLSYNFAAVQSRNKESSLFKSFQTGDFPAPHKSQVEPRKAHEGTEFLFSDHSNKEQQNKRKFFGVEISEKNNGTTIFASQMPGPHPFILGVPQPDMANFESSSISTWRKIPNGLNQNVISVRGNPYSNTFAQSNKHPITVMDSSEVIGSNLLVNGKTTCVPSLKTEGSLQNDPFYGSKLTSTESWVHNPSISFGYPNGVLDRESVSEQFNQHGTRNNFMGLGCEMDAKTAVPQNLFQREATSSQSVISIESAEKENSRRGLSWLRDIALCNGKSSKEKEGSSRRFLDLNYFREKEGYSQKANRTEVVKGLSQSFIHDPLSASCAAGSEQGKLDFGDRSSNKKAIEVSTLTKTCVPKDLPSLMTPNCHGSSVCRVESVRLFNTNLANDPLTSKSSEDHNTEEPNLEKGLFNCSAERLNIDLNLSVTEELVAREPQLTASSSRIDLEIAVEIDLEAPIIVEPDLGVTGGESFEREHEKHCNSSQDKSSEPQEVNSRVAAEALVAISSSHMHIIDTNAYSHQVESSPGNTLQWFADIVSSYKGDVDEGNQLVSMDKDFHLLEESIPIGFDYFEFMTLSLPETKMEEYHYRPDFQENRKSNNTPKRVRRGRGRQRKDFQRDILPGLVSLSRKDVNKDFQTIEGLVRASGGTWELGLSHRNTAKSGLKRGRRSSMCSDPSPTVTSVNSEKIQQPQSKELGCGETSLAGWGKRTRRLPRQRCLIIS